MIPSKNHSKDKILLISKALIVFLLYYEIQLVFLVLI